LTTIILLLLNIRPSGEGSAEEQPSRNILIFIHLFLIYLASFG